MPSHGYALYLALGDSLSIDKFAGPGLGAASLLHRNQDQLHAEFAGRDLVHLNPACRLLNRAEDGQTSEAVLDQLDHLPRERGPTLITLTVGGNDLIALLSHGSRDLTEVLARIESIVRFLEGYYPNSTVLLGNVYDPSDGTGRVQSGHERFAAGLPVLGQLNSHLRELAQTTRVRLIDIHGHFLGHGMRCSDPGYAHYRPNDPTGWICFDIEPNLRGSSEIRRLFWEALP